MTIDPKELLSAYATGDVNDDERQAVEDYLDREPGARDELRAIEVILAEVRAAEPRPTRMPDLDALAASAMSEIAGAQPSTPMPPAPRPWMKLGAWSAGLAAVAMALIFLVIRNDGSDLANSGGDADGGAVVRSQTPPDSHDLVGDLPSAEWLLPRPEPQLATAESLDVLADDWMIGDDQQDDVILDDLELEELKAIDEALASL